MQEPFKIDFQKPKKEKPLVVRPLRDDDSLDLASDPEEEKPKPLNYNKLEQQKPKKTFSLRKKKEKSPDNKKPSKGSRPEIKAIIPKIQSTSAKKRLNDLLHLSPNLRTAAGVSKSDREKVKWKVLTKTKSDDGKARKKAASGAKEKSEEKPKHKLSKTKTRSDEVAKKEIKRSKEQTVSRTGSAEKDTVSPPTDEKKDRKKAKAKQKWRKKRKGTEADPTQTKETKETKSDRSRQSGGKDLLFAAEDEASEVEYAPVPTDYDCSASWSIDSPSNLREMSSESGDRPGRLRRFGRRFHRC
ncbi:hypothetical protein Q1695_012290 [Nippostrongylus brasiliensis]|nr:hypothetical protein Q1695_012290 [Nippostrongylus brasiliensis]